MNIFLHSKEISCSYYMSSCQNIARPCGIITFNAILSNQTNSYKSFFHVRLTRETHFLFYNLCISLVSTTSFIKKDTIRRVYIFKKTHGSIDIVLSRIYLLTHWGRVTHIYVANLTIIGSDNGLSPGRRQAII